MSSQKQQFPFPLNKIKRNWKKSRQTVVSKKNSTSFFFSKNETQKMMMSAEEGGKRNGILFRKLFGPTIKRNCFSDHEKLLQILGWRRKIYKFFEITRTIIWTVKGQKNFWTSYWRFQSDYIGTLNWKKKIIIGM